MKICYKCGRNYETDLEKCPNCSPVETSQIKEGNKVEDLTSRSNSEESELDLEKINRKKFKKKVLIIGIIIILFSGLALYGKKLSKINSEAEQKKELVSLLKDGNIKKLTGLLYAKNGDSSIKLTAEEIKPLVNYFKQYPDSLDNFQKELLTNSIEWIGVKERGKKNIIFPKYTYNIEKRNIKISSELPNVTMKLEGKELKKKNNVFLDKEFIPGIYDFSMVVKTAEEKKVLENKFNLVDENAVNYTPSLFEFGAIFRSKIEGVEVFLDGKSIGKVKDNKLKVPSKLFTKESVELTIKGTHNGRAIAIPPQVIQVSAFKPTDKGLKEIEIYYPFVKVTVNTNIGKGDLLLNDKKIASISDKLVLDTFLVNKKEENKLKAVKKFSNSQIETNEMNIFSNKLEQTIELNDDSSISEESIQSFLDKLVNIMKFARVRDKAEYFEDGEDNVKFSMLKNLEFGYADDDNEFILKSLERVEANIYKISINYIFTKVKVTGGTTLGDKLGVHDTSVRSEKSSETQISDIYLLVGENNDLLVANR